MSAAKPVISTGNDTQMEQIFRDRFGMRKMIVFLSRGGKLVALESEGGKTVWERYVAMESADASKIPEKAVVIGKELLLIRTTAEQFPPVLMVVMTTAGEDGKPVVITHVLNAMDGTDFGATPLAVQGGQLESALVLPFALGVDEPHPVALIFQNHQVSLSGHDLKPTSHPDP